MNKKYVTIDLETIGLNLQTCMDRAEVKSEVTHNAVDDCIDTIKVLRVKGI